MINSFHENGIKRGCKDQSEVRASWPETLCITKKNLNEICRCISKVCIQKSKRAQLKWKSIQNLDCLFLRIKFLIERLKFLIAFSKMFFEKMNTHRFSIVCLRKK